jgi:hypothetical protein
MFALEREMTIIRPFRPHHMSLIGATETPDTVDLSRSRTSSFIIHLHFSSMTFSSRFRALMSRLRERTEPEPWHLFHAITATDK